MVKVAKQVLERFVTHKKLPIVLALLAMLLVLPAVWTGWQQDDLAHRYFLLGYPDVEGKAWSPLNIFAFLDGDSVREQKMMDEGIHPWWTLENVRLSFWRPLSAILHWMDYALWPNSDILMHIQNLIWFGALVAIVTILYRRYIGMTWAAGLAALFFAIDDAHGLPAGWISNRNAVISAFFGVLVLLVHDKWRRENWRYGVLVSPVVLLIGLLSGESALAVVGYLVAYAIFLESGTWRRRAMVLLPYAIVAGVWMVIYNQLGYGTWGSGFYIDPLSEPFTYVKAVLERAPLLLMDQFGFPPSSIVILLSPATVSAIWIWALIFLALLSIVMIPLIRHNQTARFWALGMILCLPPICATIPHSRLLFFVGIGAMGLVAQWVVAFSGRTDSPPVRKGWRRLGRVFFVALIAIHTVIAPLLLPLNAVSAFPAKRYIQDAVNNAPLDADLTEQDLVIVNPPNVLFAHYFLMVRALDNASLPRHLRVLAPGDVQLHITRPDERTLIVRPDGGFLASPFDNLFRGPQHQLRLGERVQLTKMSAEVTELTPDGRPAEVAFRFGTRLEDTSLKWLKWEDGRYVIFEPPVPGTETSLPAAQLGF